MSWPEALVYTVLIIGVFTFLIAAVRTPPAPPRELPPPPQPVTWTTSRPKEPK